MRTSLAAFATDFYDEGIEPALDNIQLRGGVDGVMLASVYHHARDVFPHNPVRRVRFLEGGRAFFNPDPSRYPANGLRPVPSSFAPDHDPVAELRAATRARGMRMHCWTVFTHNSLLGSQHPEAVTQNAYGDPQITALCPANPLVADYCRGLAADLARYEIDSVVAESLHFDVLEHGYHHERYLIDLGPIDRLLLGLCFCRHCRLRGKAAGVDVASLVSSVRARLDAAFDSAHAYDATAAELSTVSGLWGGELRGYLDARASAVAELTSTVGEALHDAGTTLAFIDPAGAMKGYADGEPIGGPAIEVSWKVGVDLALVSQSCDAILAVGYAADPQRVSADLAAYRSLLAEGCDLRLALRPMAPDCTDQANLAAKLRAAAAAAVSGVDFYHYGFMRLEDLDKVKLALHSQGGHPSDGVSQ